jgi:two-component system phosphate regulon sensor histidine kinase PhoR
MTALILLALAGAVFGVAAVLLVAANQRLRRKHRAEVDELKESAAERIAAAHAERDVLLDALGDAFLLVDATSQIRFANARARELFHGRELVGRPVMEAFLDEQLAASLLTSLGTGEPTTQQVVLPQQAAVLGDHVQRGVNAWVIDAAPLSHGADAEPYTRVIIRDVTAEHHAEQVRKDFVANASHELRTPLAIISGYLENLIDDDLLDDPVISRRFLKVMRKHAERISRIVEDMLVISRLESGEAGALKIEPFRLLSCVNDVLERLESMIRRQQAVVQVCFEDPEVVVAGDRFYWTQVLFNLVENALKQNVHEGLQLEIRCARDSEGLEVSVADNGVGIPSGDLPFIFKRFYRVQKHHNQDQIKGTGLGLSIVQRAITAHGGEISVTSVPGSETRFTIRLPR